MPSSWILANNALMAVATSAGSGPASIMSRFVDSCSVEEAPMMTESPYLLSRMLWYTVQRRAAAWPLIPCFSAVASAVSVASWIWGLMYNLAYNPPSAFYKFNVISSSASLLFEMLRIQIKGLGNGDLSSLLYRTCHLV